MKYLKFLLLAFFLTTNAYAADGPASEASVKELLVVMQSKKMLEKTYENLEAMMKPALDQIKTGQPMNAQQRKIVDDIPVQMKALMQKELNWETMEPAMLAAYRQVFTEEEVRGMITFYQSPTGKVVVEKMPRVAQLTAASSQDRIKSMLPKLRQLMADMAEKMRAAADK
jgi:hypothetical protein